MVNQSFQPIHTTIKLSRYIFCITFLLYLILSSNISFSQVVNCIQDRDVLVELAKLNAVETPTNSGVFQFPGGQTTWDFNKPIADLPGVLVDAADQNKITHLNMSGFGLTSEIPISIGCFGELEVLNLSDNQLTGNIPRELWELKTLRTLNLNNNQLTGELPNQLIGFNDLRILYLSGNQLTGALPSLDDVTINITDFDLSGNLFEGSIPASYNNRLTNLFSFIIRDNEINDILSVDFMNFQSLEELDLSGNNIDELPDDWQLPPFLTELYIQNNKLTFKDFLPNNINYILDVNGQLYFPQDSVGIARRIVLVENQAVEISYEIDVNIAPPANYKWFKDGVDLNEPTNESKKEIANAALDDEGTYVFHSTHPNVPNLTLYSRPVTLWVAGSCDKNDEDALNNLRLKTNGHKWNRPWNVNDEVKTWEGVTVDQTTGCVVALEIDDQALEGEIPN
ncbi:MAG: hypothetical protein AAGI07_14350, partial [Bacteroidota bacterium]